MLLLRPFSKAYSSNAKHFYILNDLGLRSSDLRRTLSIASIVLLRVLI